MVGIRVAMEAILAAVEEIMVETERNMVDIVENGCYGGIMVAMVE